MKKIPFTIEIKGKQYAGHLQVTDIGNVPKTFFVFLSNYIVADLFFRDDGWLFDQGGRYKTLGKLSDDDCKTIADYLGNIAMLAYE